MEKATNIVAIAELMSKETIKRNRAAVEPESIVLLPVEPLSEDTPEEIPREVYAARVDDVIVLLCIWCTGDVSVQIV